MIFFFSDKKNSERSLNQVRMSTVRLIDIAVDGEVEKEYSYQTDSEEEDGDHSSVVVVTTGRRRKRNTILSRLHQLE